MKRTRLLPYLLGGLLLGVPCVCLAQDAQQGTQQRPDQLQRAITQARRDGRMVDLEKLLREQIQQLETANQNNGQLAIALMQLAAVVAARGEPVEAETLRQRAYEVDRTAYGPSSLRVASDLTQQAREAKFAQRPQDAETLLMQAMDMVHANQSRISSTADNGLAAYVAGTAAILYLEEHRWQEADPLVQEEKRYCDAIPEPYRGGYGECGSLSGQLTRLYAEEGRSVEAEQVPKELQVPAELAALEQSAEQYKNNGLYPSAEDTYARAITLAQKIEADPHNRYGGLIVREMNALGQAYEKEGLLDRAESEYTGALEIDEKRAGPQPPQTEYAILLDPHYLIALYRTENRYKNAEAILQTVLDVQVKALGDRHRAVVATMTRLADLYREEGRGDSSKYAQALPLYMRVVEIQELNLGASNLGLIPALANYADILRRVHQEAQAAQVMARINVLYRSQNPPK